MYAGGRIRAFEEFSLRRLVELDAMKLFFLFAERRDRGSNLANISYDGIERYTGIARQRIKPATSLLAALSMVYVEQTLSSQSEFGVSERLSGQARVDVEVPAVVVLHDHVFHGLVQLLAALDQVDAAPVAIESF
jgi:hypothetical protein